MRNSKFGIRGFVFLLLILFMQAQCVSAQSQEKVYASMILNFSRGIQWPRHATDDKFVIGILEYPPLATELRTATQIAKVGGKSVDIKQFTYADEIQHCHVLFIPAYKARQVPQVMQTIGNKPTLVITNKTDLAKKTGGINLILLEGKLKYEVNIKSIEKKGMKISAAVKALGITVE